MGKASAVMRTLVQSLFSPKTQVKRLGRNSERPNGLIAIFGCHETRIAKKVKLSVGKTVFFPILTYGHESCAVV